MKLKYKILSGIVIILIISILSIIFLMTYNQLSFKKYLGEQSIKQSNSILNEIDREIKEKLDESKFHGESLIIIEELKKSNEYFENISDRENYIDNIDNLWINNKSEIQEIINNIISNKGSVRLNDINEFYTKQEDFTVYHEIFVTNKYGVVVSSTGITSDYRQNDENWWKESFENEIYFEEPLYDVSSNETGFIIAHKLYNENGEFIGIIKEILSLKKIKDIIEEASMIEEDSNESDELEIKLLTKNGSTIYQSENTLYEIKDFSKFNFFKKLINKQGYLIITEEWDLEDSDEKIFISYSKSSGYKEFIGLGWILIIEYELEDILKPIYKIQITLILFTIIFSILLLIFGLIFSNLISKPIKKLEEATKELEKGNFETTINFKSNDELGLLSDSFNKMTNKIKESNNKIKKDQENLEKRIKERTKELEEINKELEKFNKLSTGRELEMIKLKKELAELKK